MRALSASRVSHYIRYVFCLVLSTVLAAPVGLFVLAHFSGAFIRLEVVSLRGLWFGVGSATCVAAVAFWLLMNAGRPSYPTDIWRVAATAAASALVLALLGQVAAWSADLEDYVAAGVWFALMLTVGFLPFAPRRRGD